MDIHNFSPLVNSKYLPPQGIEPWIFGLRDRRLTTWPQRRRNQLTIFNNEGFVYVDSVESYVYAQLLMSIFCFVCLYVCIFMYMLFDMLNVKKNVCGKYLGALDVSALKHVCVFVDSFNICLIKRMQGVFNSTLVYQCMIATHIRTGIFVTQRLCSVS